MFVPDAPLVRFDVFGVRKELVDICQRCAGAERRDTHMTAPHTPERRTHRSLLG